MTLTKENAGAIVYSWQHPVNLPKQLKCTRALKVEDGVQSAQSGQARDFRMINPAPNNGPGVAAQTVSPHLLLVQSSVKPPWSADPDPRNRARARSAPRSTWQAEQKMTEGAWAAAGTHTKAPTRAIPSRGSGLCMSCTPTHRDCAAASTRPYPHNEPKVGAKKSFDDHPHPPRPPGRPGADPEGAAAARDPLMMTRWSP